MRPRPGAKPQPPWNAGVRPRGPHDLPCSGGFQRPASRRLAGRAHCSARPGLGGPLGTRAFFWPPRYSFAVAGLAAPPSPSGPRCSLLTPSWWWPSALGPPELPAPRSWRGRGGPQPPVPQGRGEAGRAQLRPRPARTSPDPLTSGPPPGRTEIWRPPDSRS